MGRDEVFIVPKSPGPIENDQLIFYTMETRLIGCFDLWDICTVYMYGNQGLLLEQISSIKKKKRNIL